MQNVQKFFCAKTYCATVLKSTDDEIFEPWRPSVYVPIATDLVHILSLPAMRFPICPEVHWALFLWLIHCCLVLVDFFIFLWGNGCSLKSVHHCVMTVIWFCFGTPDLLMILVDRPSDLLTRKDLCDLSKPKQSPFIAGSLGHVSPLWNSSENNMWAHSLWIQLTVGCRDGVREFPRHQTLHGGIPVGVYFGMRRGTDTGPWNRISSEFFLQLDIGISFSISLAVVWWWSYSGKSAHMSKAYS